MDHIHNDNLWCHEIKMAAIVGRLSLFCMDDYGKKNFERSYLGQERRYWALTHRYGYRTVKRMHKSDFWVIFKALLEWCSFAYAITISECKILPWPRYDRSKFSSHSCPHKTYKSHPTKAAIFISSRHKSSLWIWSIGSIGLCKMSA